jgi:ABC-type uncharacterized transport system permease subunit
MAVCGKLLAIAYKVAASLLVSVSAGGYFGSLSEWLSHRRHLDYAARRYLTKLHIVSVRIRLLRLPPVLIGR